MSKTTLFTLSTYLLSNSDRHWKNIFRVNAGAPVCERKSLTFFSDGWKMKIMRNIAIIVCVLCAVSLTGCDGVVQGDFFNSDLRGIWECTNHGGYCGHRLVIDLDTITISGSIDHFSGFTKTLPLEGYSKDGFLYINDRGVLQNGIAYRYWTTGAPVTRMLTLPAGGWWAPSDETFKRISD
jgi:hypothetical protein